IGRLRTLFQKLRAAFPRARLRVRLDGGFAGEDLLAFLEAEAVEYVVALGSNRRVEKRAQRLMGKARVRSKASGETEHLFGETRYAAKTWSRKRRIVMKAEVVRHPGRAPKNNPRFVVTSLALTPAHVYQVYRERGDVENRIKELKDGLALDRLSCVRFLGNQFRLLLTAAGVHPGASAPAPRRRAGVRRAASDELARPRPQGGRVDRALRPPHRPALPRVVSLAADVVPDCLRRRRHALRRFGTAPRPDSGRRVATD